MSNRTTTANTVSALIQPTFCYRRVEVKYILFIQLTQHLSVHFRQKYLKKQNTASAETAWQFLASKVLVLRLLVREHLAIQFSTARKTLSHDNIFKISDFPITCSRAVCHLGIIVIIYISPLPDRGPFLL